MPELSEEDRAPMAKRRIQFHLELGADDWPEVVRVLENIALDIERGEIPRDQVSGGWSSGHHCWSTEDSAQTGDLYRAQLEEWRQARVRAIPRSAVPALIDALEAAQTSLQTIRELHLEKIFVNGTFPVSTDWTPTYQGCAVCLHEPWPCATFRALDGAK